MAADLQQSHRARRIATYRQFWPFYLNEHSRPGTRRLHYLGTGGALLALILTAVVSEPWLLLAVPLSGYGFAWIAHFKVERNRPTTLRYPLWSLISDVRMFALWATGRIGAEIARHRNDASSRTRP